MVEKYTNPVGHWRWRSWHVNGNEYLRGDVAVDDGWLMWCLADTQDRPAPQMPYPPGYGYPTTPTWAEHTESTSILIVGHRYQFVDALYLRSARLWLPDGMLGAQAELWRVTDPLGTPEYSSLLPNFVVESDDIDRWIDVSMGNFLVVAGQAVDIVAVCRPNTGLQQFTYQWQYNRGNGDPASGNIQHQNNNQADMRVHQNDFGGTDRTTDLDNLGPGSVVSFGGMRWNIVAISKTGSVYYLTVEPATRGTAGLYDVTFTWIGAAALEYVRADDWWPENPGHDIGSWPLNDQSGNALDVSGNGHDMVWQAGSYPANSITGPGGRMARATTFGNGNHWLQALNVATVSNIPQVSASCWCRMSGVSSRMSLFGMDTNSTPRAWSLRTRTDGDMELFAAATGNVGVDGYHLWTTPRIDDGQWHHLGFTFDNGTVQFYVDGVPVTSTDISVNNPPNTFSIGANFGAGARGGSALDFFNGDLADVRLWTEVLTDSEMAYLALLDVPAGVIQGLFSDTGYADVVANYHGYGTDLEYQRVIPSPDWDLMSRTAL